MKKELYEFAVSVAAAIAKKAINNLVRKGLEFSVCQVYIKYNEEEKILRDIKAEVTITSDNPLTLSHFSFLRHTVEGETVGVIYGKKLLKLAETPAYQFPINIDQMFIRFKVFEYLEKKFNIV